MTFDNADRQPLFVAQPHRRANGEPLMQRVFIANRGEIACRIIATCRKLGIISIAICVQEDLGSLHITEADEFIQLGGIDLSGRPNPYLDIDLLIEIALGAGADAVHPGYGYLSENPDFADRVRAAGMIFIGPSSEAMATLGNKRTSKAYLLEHAPEVPLIPGFSGTAQSHVDLEDAARLIGFPIMLKASAGGGGKGMRVVHEASALVSELERAKSEAKRSFGSADVILEKFIDAAKHVEIQVVGDQHGRVISLWDRDCSVQRRNQKVIEETPCTWLSADMRKRMSETAVRIAQMLHYEGAGTVEFVVDVKTAAFYFLEVNTRLQVEHPITEEVTGVDLVALQIYVATGGRLEELTNLRDISQQGHAIECRLCAEDANNDFFPQYGPIRLWQPAPGILGPGRNIRYETALQTGAQVSIYFDSMIAKIVVWEPTRSQAIDTLLKVMANTTCLGVRTNQLFLQDCLQHPGFRNPGYTTSFIPNLLNEPVQRPHKSYVRLVQSYLPAIATAYLKSLRKTTSAEHPFAAFRSIRSGFRNQSFEAMKRSASVVLLMSGDSRSGEKTRQEVLCLCEAIASNTPGMQAFEMRTSPLPSLDDRTDGEPTRTNAVTGGYNSISAAIRSRDLHSTPVQRVEFQQATKLNTPAASDWSSHTVTASIDGIKHSSTICFQHQHDDSIASQTGKGQSVYVHSPRLGTWVGYQICSLLSYSESLRIDEDSLAGTSKAVKAPMPCKVLRVLKEDGGDVNAGEIVMILESMKMEVNIAAPTSGRFKAIFKEGSAADQGEVLCEID